MTADRRRRTADRGSPPVVHRRRSAAFSQKARSLAEKCDLSAPCMRRMQERLWKGGHAGPEEDLRRRYSRSKKNFWTLYHPKVNRWVLFRNTERALRLVAEGEEGMQSILRRDGYGQFFQDLSLSP